jgi:hypothetical protein
MDRLEIAYADFAADLRRIEHLVELVRVLRQFGASEPPEISGTSEWDDARALWQNAKDRRTDLPLLAGSLLMYMAGRFEFYVRQLVEVAAEEMAVTVDSYGKLPEKFRACLKFQVLELAQNPRRYGFDDVRAEGHLKDFADLLIGNYDANKVSSALMSLTEANLKSRVLADITKRLGMENLWKNIGKQAPLKLALEKTTDGETTADAQSRLDVLMDERNSLAHPTGEMTFPDPEKVIETAKFITAFSQALRDLFRVYLVQWKTETAN